MNWLWLVIGICLVAGAFLSTFMRGPSSGRDDSEYVLHTRDPSVIMEDEPTAFAEYAGSASCRECHEQAFALWGPSNHGLAERDPNLDLDRPAFDPARTFAHGSQSSEASTREGRLQLLTLGFDNEREAYEPDRILGNYPLRQLLIPRPGGRWQVTELAYDPRTNDWFDVYGEEDRVPGEWGHWTGRGMNWNNMCAACHNTRLRKNYDVAADTYDTTMVEMGVGCEACHGPMKTHVQWQRAYQYSGRTDPTILTLSTNLTLSMCGSCHARRADLTGDFTPGESFFDHYSLTIVDETDIYYPDGQVREEDYEYASFLSSRMYMRGVYCLDCHQPHSAATLVEGNDLCLRCHNGSYAESPEIDPVAHGFHKPEGGGNECVGCHMPITNYMVRDPRHDHGFTIPDPLLTKELGIPNACSRCHADQDVDWAIKYVDEWYGERMNRHTRDRARWVAAARRGEETVKPHLLEMLASEEVTYWRATAASLLGRWLSDPPVVRALIASLDQADPLVREKAVRALDPLVDAGHPGARQAIQARLRDAARSVRIAAAWALRASVDPNSRAGKEMLHTLELNADQPAGRLQKGAYELARENPEGALEHLRLAVEWDPNSAPLRHEYAVVLSMLGRSRNAVEELEAACRLDPRQAEYRFKLALAWNELNSLKNTVAALEEAVRLDPRHHRAWYNLGLARNAAGQPEAAVTALARAESVQPEDPMVPYARATILLRLGRTDEARIAARRALEIRPDFAAARQLLDSVR